MVIHDLDDGYPHDLGNLPTCLGKFGCILQSVGKYAMHAWKAYGFRTQPVGMATKKGPKPGGSVRVAISDYNVYI